jgi:hypothetical protein
MKISTVFAPQVLELSSDSDLEVVFQLVNLWLSNSQKPPVNALIEELVTSAHFASYKFAPLMYQIFSRIDGSADVSPGKSLLGDAGGRNTGNRGKSGNSGSNSGNSGRAGDGDAEFQIVLRRLVLKLCADHPHHALPQLCALAHEVRGEWVILSILIIELLPTYRYSHAVILE